MVRTAHWISITLHPVFMPLITLWLALRVDPHLGYFLHEQARLMVLLMVGVMTVVFPLTSTLLLMRAGLVGGIRMLDRRERVAPFVMTLIYYAMAYYLLQRSPLHPAVLSIFTGVLVGLALTIAITLYWKISAHMVGIGGLIGALWGLSSVHGLPLLGLLTACILVAGILGSARLYVGEHQQMQVHAGLALGALCTYTCVAFGWAF